MLLFFFDILNVLRNYLLLRHHHEHFFDYFYFTITEKDEERWHVALIENYLFIVIIIEGEGDESLSNINTCEGSNDNDVVLNIISNDVVNDNSVALDLISNDVVNTSDWETANSDNA